MKYLWLLLASFLAGCSSGSKISSYFHTDNVDISDLNDKNATTVSVILPLTGTWAATGEAFQNAALLALDEPPNAPVRLLFFDTKSTADGAEQAYQWATAQSPDIILGPVFADEFRALPSPSLMNQPVLGYTSDSTLLNSERASFAVLIPEQIHEIVRQNCLSGKRQLAVIGPDNKTGEIVMNALEDALQQCPEMSLANYALYDAKKADMSADILKILPPFINPKKKNLTDKEKELLATPMQERLKFDSLLVFEDGTKLTQVMSILAFYDVTPGVVPIYALASAKSVKDRSVNGVLMTDLPADRTFTQKYKNVFGHTPIRLASLSYDSVGWIAEQALKGPVSLKTLRSQDAYYGADGWVKLNNDGTNKRGLRLVRKTSRGVAEVVPPPSELSDAPFMSGLMEDSMIITESADSASLSPSKSDESLGDFQSASPVLPPL